MKDFRHKNILFIGDAAHQVSPFGARGANSGIQDTDNLVWKLNLVVKGQAPASLLDTYSQERVYAADENLMNSTRSTDFITPKSAVSKVFRNSVLELAKTLPFARSLVNSGRLSVPSYLYQSSLNTPDIDQFVGSMIPGAPIDDAPIEVNGKADWLLRHVGNQFSAVIYVEGAIDQSQLDLIDQASVNGIKISPIVVSSTKQDHPSIKVLHDVKGLFKARFDAKPGTVYLVRPDQHVSARWRKLDSGLLKAALAVSTGNGSK